MDCEQIEEKLDLIIEEIHRGLSNLAATTRSNGTPDDIADQLDQMAWDICKHWPTCFAEHEPYIPGGQAQKT